ncbi:hypothetical protein D3C78_1799390 [compost metagenome]
MQAVFVTNDVLGTQGGIFFFYFTGQQCQQGDGIGVQQAFSFICQQQVTQVVQHRQRLLVSH